MCGFRLESDSIGKKEVPINAYYGVQTLRAYENFRISDTKTNAEFISKQIQHKTNEVGIMEYKDIDLKELTEFSKSNDEINIQELFSM
jgi:aspartate ammonia-lyase